jgi:hypothetical protein
MTSSPILHDLIMPPISNFAATIEVKEEDETVNEERDLEDFHKTENPE